MRHIIPLLQSVLVLAWLGTLGSCTDGDFKGTSGKTSDKEDGGNDGPGGDGEDGGPDGSGDSGGIDGGGIDGPADSGGDGGADGGIDGGSDAGDDGGISIPEDCTNAGATQAKLLTETVKNGKPNNYIEYELFLTDCDGNRKEIDSDRVLFDIDAFSKGVGEGIALEYSIAELSMEGKLEEVKGSDLFGKKGPNLFHYRTDKQITLEPGQKSLVIRIELMGLSFNPDDSDTFPGDEAKLATYLTFGDAAPVSKRVVFEGSGEYKSD